MANKPSKNRSAIMLAEVFPPDKGGIQTLLFNIANLHPNISVITPKQKKTKAFDKKQNFTIFRKGQRPIKGLSNKITRKIGSMVWPGSGFDTVVLKEAWWFLFGNALSKNIKVIHCGHIRAGLTGLIFKKLFSIPYFINVHGLEINLPLYKPGPRKKYLRKIFQNADKIFSCSQQTKSICLKYGAKPEKVVVTPLGVNLKKFNPQISGSTIRERYNLTDKKVLFSVSRLVKRKGFDQVIKALPEIIKKIPNTVYLLAGDGPDKSRLTNLVKKYNLQDRVIFTGRVKESELGQFYAAADLFTMPNRELKNGDIEGFGIVYLEAAACAKPVIGGNSGGARDAVKDNETGLLVNPIKTREVAQAIVRILSDNKLGNRLGQAGRRRVEQEYNWPKTIEKILIAEKELK